MKFDGFEESIKAGFASGLPVMSKYEFVDHPLDKTNGRVLVASGEPVSYFYHASVTQLPSIFGKLNPEKENEILKFVSRYGVLGSKKLPRTTKIAMEKAHEEASQHFKHNFLWERSKYLDEFAPETLEWIQQHIKTVRLVLELLTSIQEEDESSIVKLIKGHEIEVKESPINRQNPLATLGEVSMNGYPWLELEPMRFGIELVETVLNKNMKPIRRKVTFKDKHFQSYFVNDTLIEIIYWQIANIAEGGELKRCLHCNTPFLSLRSDQKFCSYDPVFEKESRCALAHRQKQYRERKKNEKND